MRNEKPDIIFTYLAIFIFMAAVVVCGLEFLVSEPSPAATPAATATATASPIATNTATVAAIVSAPTFTPTPAPTSPPPTSTATPTPTATVSPTPAIEMCLIQQNSIYAIQPGDTLWRISECAYGDPLLWPVIFLANPQLSDPHLIHAGNSLIIPRRRIDG